MFLEQIFKKKTDKELQDDEGKSKTIFLKHFLFV